MFIRQQIEQKPKANRYDQEKMPERFKLLMMPIYITLCHEVYI